MYIGNSSMTLQQFNQNYTYTEDGALDSWTVIEPIEGKYKGDCEDYCLTLQAIVDGYKDLELYYCHYNSTGHCIGKINGKWIDCILQREVETLPPSYTNVRKYWLIEILSKRLYGRIFRWLNNCLKK